MNDRDLFLIGDIPGFTPQIGRLVSMMNYARYTTLSAVEGLEVYELDYLHDPQSNSIGALLSHIAASEVGYQPNSGSERNLPSCSKFLLLTKGRMLSCLMAGQHEADSP